MLSQKHPWQVHLSGEVTLTPKCLLSPCLRDLRDFSHAWAEGSASAASRGPSLRQIQIGASVDGGDAFQCWWP
jgi:hypothetical protein